MRAGVEIIMLGRTKTELKSEFDRCAGNQRMHRGRLLLRPYPDVFRRNPEFRIFAGYSFE